MKIYQTSIVVLLMLVATGCNSVKLEAVSDSTNSRPDGEYIHTVRANGSFFNLENNNIRKQPDKVIKGDRHFLIKDGADYIGSKNSKVVYSISYWDSICAVFSFGFYVPLSIEYTPNKQ